MMRTIMLGAALLLVAGQQASAQSAEGPPPGALFYSCGSVEEVETQALAHLSAAAPDAVEREAHLKAAQEAIGKIAIIRADLLAGKAVDAPYQRASRFAALSTAAGSGELAELYRRTAEDQFLRLHLSAATERISWAKGLSDPARAYAYWMTLSQGCTVDAENARWLKDQVGKHGWFTVSKYGKDADFAAWLLVQHADRDVPFQGEMLAVLEPLISAKETSQSNFAYLYDRVAVNSGRPQRYGTQGRCTVAGSWEPREVEQPDKLDERRAAVGLPPEAEYIAIFNCTGAPRA